LPQANILKQTALTIGADCAVHKDILTAKTYATDCILGGSISQIKKIAQKIITQPFSMDKLAIEIENILDLYTQDTKQPKIVGILNLTKNSFSDGGKYYEYEDAIKHLNNLIEDGADIIDIGAESTKPNSTEVSAEEQLRLIDPILKYINSRNIITPISIDTRSSIVAKQTIDLGATIINDVSGLTFDKNMAKIIANSEAKIVIQHSQGIPQNMQDNITYEHLIDDIYLNLKNIRLKYALESGIKKENVILDVGIGFGKTKSQNFELIKRIDEFKSIGCDLMLGVSRKSLLDMNDRTNEEKDIFTVALNTLAINKNVEYLRVHNVKLHKELINLMENF
jgi:dihydropteroate synthase